jgi:hypothetical protein
MRLSYVATDMQDRTFLNFDCKCHFEYRMSARVQEEREDAFA